MPLAFPSRDPKVAAFWVRWLLLAALFCWPAFALGHAALFWDTVGYYKHGYAAVTITAERIEAKSGFAPVGLAPNAQAQTRGSAHTTPPHDQLAVSESGQDPAHEVRGARSIIYSIMTYLLAAPGVSMLALVAVQALAAGFVTVALLDRFQLTGWAPFAGVSLVAGFGTTAPWFASFALPDIFAAIGIAGLALLLTGTGSMRRESRVALLVLTALSLALHASHLLDAAAVLLMAGIASARAWVGSGRQMRTVLLAGSTLVIGALVVAATGYLAFGEISIAPKRYPLTLARVIENGPGRWYLARSCNRLHYEICTVMPDPPRTAAEIVFGPRGLKNIATSEQLDRIRAEEIRIVVRATEAYPRETLDIAVGSSLRQLTRFGLVDLSVDQQLVKQAPGMVTLAADDPNSDDLRDRMERVTNAIGWLSVALLPLVLWFCVSERRLLSLIVGGIVANGIICASLSAVADRYQGRVMWLLPVIVFALITRALRERLSVRADERGSALTAEGNG